MKEELEGALTMLLVMFVKYHLFVHLQGPRGLLGPRGSPGPGGQRVSAPPIFLKGCVRSQ